MAQYLHQGAVKLLVVDVGNTSTAVGLWSDGRVSHVSHCDVGFKEAAEAARKILTQRHRDAEGVEGLAYVSVVPNADVEWQRFARKCGLSFFQVSHRQFARKTSLSLRASALNLRLDYPHPETIGADRLADAAGAVNRYGAPVLVMDFGGGCDEGSRLARRCHCARFPVDARLSLRADGQTPAYETG